MSAKCLKRLDLNWRQHRRAKTFERFSKKDCKFSGLMFDLFAICRWSNGQVWVICTLCSQNLLAGHNAMYDRCFMIAYRHLQEHHTDLARELETLDK